MKLKHPNIVKVLYTHREDLSCKAKEEWKVYLEYPGTRTLKDDIAEA